MRATKKQLGAAIAKGVFAFAAGFLALMNLTGATLSSLVHLGYPEYFGTILGVAYVLGLVALYQPLWKWLQNWAWGGFAAAIVGAVASHLFVGDPLANAVPAIFLLLLLVIAVVLKGPD